MGYNILIVGIGIIVRKNFSGEGGRERLNKINNPNELFLKILSILC